MKKIKRFEIKLSERDRLKLEKVASRLNMSLSQVFRNSLNYGLAALLKFETGSKEAWKAITREIEKEQGHEPAPTVTEENIPQYTPEQKAWMEEQIKIANSVKWLTDEEDK